MARCIVYLFLLISLASAVYCFPYHMFGYGGYPRMYGNYPRQFGGYPRMYGGDIPDYMNPTDIWDVDMAHY